MPSFQSVIESCEMHILSALRLTRWHLKGDRTRPQPIRDIYTSFFSNMVRIPSQTLAAPMLTVGWTTCPRAVRNPPTSALATQMDQIKLELIESISHLKRPLDQKFHDPSLRLSMLSFATCLRSSSSASWIRTSSDLATWQHDSYCTIIHYWQLRAIM